jgi:hypothetical protein
VLTRDVCVLVSVLLLPCRPELAFMRVPGVIATEVGYSQGKVEEPSYEDVCSGQTGHVEVVQVTYNAQEVRTGLWGRGWGWGVGDGRGGGGGDTRSA